MLTLDEKTVAFFRFTELRVYEKALDYSTWVITNLQHPQSEGEKQVIDDFVKCSTNISMNIAEGSSRPNVQFEELLRNCKCNLRECMTHTELCYKLGTFDEEQRLHSHDLLMELMRMIGSLIVSLQRARQRYNECDQEESE